jgi:hypothetical protein
VRKRAKCFRKCKNPRNTSSILWNSMDCCRTEIAIQLKTCKSIQSCCFGTRPTGAGQYEAGRIRCGAKAVRSGAGAVRSRCVGGVEAERRWCQVERGRDGYGKGRDLRRSRPVERIGTSGVQEWHLGRANFRRILSGWIGYLKGPAEVGPVGSHPTASISARITGLRRD